MGRHVTALVRLATQQHAQQTPVLLSSQCCCSRCDSAAQPEKPISDSDFSRHKMWWVAVQLREYEDGVLVREEPIPAEQLEAVLGKRAAPVKRRQRRARAKVTPIAAIHAAV